MPPVSLTPVANLELRISPRIFEKIRNGPNGIIRGLGETGSRKKPEAKKSRDTVPLSKDDVFFFRAYAMCPDAGSVGAVLYETQKHDISCDTIPFLNMQQM